jgi:hemerythrin
MDFIEWNNSSMVNHIAMDKEHKKMVDDTNKLYTLVNKNKMEKANKLFNKIVEDLKLHFESEHDYMVKSKTPNFISHKLEHERFYNKIRDVKTRIDAGKEELTLSHLKIVKIWFFNHLEFKDKQLADFLNERSIK